MGRETGIQKVVFGADGWPRLAQGGLFAAREVEAPKLKPHPFKPEPVRHKFNSNKLPLVFQWLRTPEPKRIFSLTARKGWLRLIGRESIGSWFEQALVASDKLHLSIAQKPNLSSSRRLFNKWPGLLPIIIAINFTISV